MNLLAQSPKGWRIRRVSEVIAAGDLKPCRGVDWEPVNAGDVGSQVLGRRDTPTDEIELIITPRKRRLSARQEARALWLKRVGRGLPVEGSLPA